MIYDVIATLAVIIGVLLLPIAIVALLTRRTPRRRMTRTSDGFDQEGRAG